MIRLSTASVKQLIVAAPYGKVPNVSSRVLYKLRILHISDLHDRGSRERFRWRQREVLGDSFLRCLDGLLKDGRIDIVCFTGDAAYSGSEDEYAEATAFFHALLTRLGLELRHLFLVPGNHDIKRSVEPEAWQTLRKLLRATVPTELSGWLAGEHAPVVAQAG